MRGNVENADSGPRRTGEGGATSTSLLGVSVESNSETMLLLESGAIAPYPLTDK